MTSAASHTRALTPSYSLLHATYRAGQRALAVRDTWYSRAMDPTDIEHIFAFDADDPISRSVPEIRTGVRGPSLAPHVITAVRNWNAAAARSTGAILIVIADDLLPPTGWDRRLRALFVDLDPTMAPFAIKVQDGAIRNEHLIRHPILSRAYYKKYGLFNPAFDGIGADNEFTLLAHKRSLVIDGRPLKFEHDHQEGKTYRSDSQMKMLTDHKSRAVWDERWPMYRRHVLQRYLRPRPGQKVIGPVERLERRAVASLGYGALLIPRSVRSRLHGSLSK